MSIYLIKLELTQLAKKIFFSYQFVLIVGDVKLGYAVRTKIPTYIQERSFKNSIGWRKCAKIQFFADHFSDGGWFR